jgi:hypothetical protein
MWESHDPSRSRLSTGRMRLAGTRHSRSAPVAVNACHNGTPRNSRSGQDELARAAGTGQAADQGDFPGAAAGESATPLGTSSTSARPQPPHWPLPPAGASRSASTAFTTLWSCGTSTWRTRSLRIHCWTWPRPTTTPYATTWTRRRDDAHVRGDSRGEDRRRTPRRRPSRQRRP